jgi:hypothetical protein
VFYTTFAHLPSARQLIDTMAEAAANPDDSPGALPGGDAPHDDFIMDEEEEENGPAPVLPDAAIFGQNENPNDPHPFAPPAARSWILPTLAAIGIASLAVILLQVLRRRRH